MGNKYFYDIHCHIMNLSHPNLSAIIKRFRLDGYLFLNSIPIINNLVSWVAGSKLNRILNLLSIMDRSIGDFLLLIEEKDYKPLYNNGKIRINNTDYDRIILTPLMMDFGEKKFIDPKLKAKIWYEKPPHKPIADQVIDLFNGIKDYYKESELKLFEIYPFLGINTKNYDMETKDGKTGLVDLLNKYFSSFGSDKISERHNKLKEKMGKFNGNIDKLGNYSFAGIKVYPPLDFDPYPEKPKNEREEKQLEKVKYLYSFCESKSIPITTHSATGGFNVLPKKLSRVYADPGKWEKVLSDYPKLKLNLAHFGGQIKNTKGFRKIIEFISDKDKQVYTDFSCLCFNDNDYKKLKKLIGEDKIRDKILFGSDFMINLMGTESYKEYINAFSKTRHFSKAEKDKFCSINPENFLFG